MYLVSNQKLFYCLITTNGIANVNSIPFESDVSNVSKLLTKRYLPGESVSFNTIEWEEV